jgi:1-acyl-sn-glycerol-3-phosphate acyltransferase
VLRALRSLLALALLALWFPLWGAFQRLVLLPYFLVRPARRLPVMDVFMRAAAVSVLWTVRLGGARVRHRGEIPTAAPVLVLMNHQSLLDIPRVVSLCRPVVPFIVTRRLYARGIPLVSMMLRIREDPLVEPDKDTKGSIAAVKRAVRRDRGMVVFPEGHRTRGGEVSPFEPAGLRVLLGERRLPVYLVVTDGYWACRTLSDFLFDMWRIDGRTDVLGPFEPPAAAAEIPEFIERMRATMVARLEGLRREGL